jgi:hypothetical protein
MKANREVGKLNERQREVGREVIIPEGKSARFYLDGNIFVFLCIKIITAGPHHLPAR